jgi:phosphoribosylformylglycinamidine synthase
MKFGVITFPGSNCDYDTIYVLETILEQKVVHLWHKETDLQGVDFVILPVRKRVNSRSFKDGFSEGL